MKVLLLKQWRYYLTRSRDQKNNVCKFFSEEILPQTYLFYKRVQPIGIELVVGNHQEFDFLLNFT
jgi:glycine dehydrogenase